jgi:type IV secretory pathway TraG/TraD family ATPase VirD4
VPAAVDAWESSQYRTDRAVDSLYATAEEVLHVYGNERVSAFTDGHDLDLYVLATTARGQGIQLVTVWHDKSQLEARYGPKASTILNNHRAKLFLSGLTDLSALELGARLIGDQALVDRNRSMGSDGRHSMNESTSYRPLLPVEDLRRLRPGEGVLLHGHLRPTPIRLRPLYAPREQARRDRAEDRAARRVARTERRPGWCGRSGKGAGDDP